MPQNNGAFVAQNPSKALVALQTDVEGNLLTSTGDITSKLNVTAAGVVKATPGRLAKVIVNGTVGTGGTLTINDAATTGSSAAGNVILSVPGTIAVGTVLSLDWPCLNGITVSSVPTGGAVVLSVSYT